MNAFPYLGSTALLCVAVLLQSGGCTEMESTSVQGPRNPTVSKPGEEPANDHGGAEARNMRLVGHDGLQGRSAYQLIPHQQGGRLLLYVGHHKGEALNVLTGEIERNGMSIVDVTEPSTPRYVSHVPPTETPWHTGDPSDAIGTQHVQVCDGSKLPRGKPGAVYVLRTLGDIAHELLDVSDPDNPRHLREVVRAGRSPYEDEPYATHKNWWDCETGIAYMVSSVSGWQSVKVLQAFDLSDPGNPSHIRDFGLVGTQPGAAGTKAGGKGIHEATPYGDRIYIAYGTFDHGVLQILDRKKFLSGNPEAADPMAPTVENLLYPQISRLDMPTYWGAHSAKPILGIEIPDYARDQSGYVRDFLLLVSEGISLKCDITRHATFFVDITEPEFPFPVSNFQVPASSGDYCERDGYFGPHAPPASYAPVFHKKIEFLSYFIAGVRAIDIRDPFRPVEVGYFIPKPNENTLAYEESDPPREIGPIIMTNNVNVDDRGYVYIVDRAGTGLHIIELTGDAREIIAQ